MAEVATKQAESDDEELPITRVLNAATRMLARLVRVLVIPAILVTIALTLANAGSREAVGAFLVAHLGFVFWGILLLGFAVWRAWEAKQRHKVIFAPRTTKRSTEKPLMRSMGKAFSDSVDILLFRDEKPWRVAYLLITAGAAALATVNAWGPKDWPFALASGDQDATPGPAILSMVGPLVWFIVVLTRLNKIFGQRSAVIEGIHGVAKSTLKYPKPGARMSPEDRRLSAAYTAVEVKEWETLTMPRRFFVLAPTTLTVTDGKSWSEFEANLGARVPHPEGWHVERERNGRGALIAPAQYPLGVLWDGEQDPDPLTFLLGANLDDAETPLSITFGEVSPHALVTGGTGSGKTSLAEAIMAQAATKPMPWDQTLFAICHVIDPKGPFANRWFGRPNMDVTNGTRDIEIEGETNSGVVAMAFHMERVFADMNARQAILDQYANLGTWIHLPDSEKVANRMTPVYIVMDEFLDHTGKDPGTSEAVLKDNAARERLMYITGLIARKGRSLGFHLILIAQDAKMTDIGSSLIRQLAARAVMGNMDIHANARMFGNDVTIPLLPLRASSTAKRRRSLVARGS
ncbi:hypothetical protein GCM10025867_47130 (plasmid) [Frondihabitans sucicola]|uniref:FtsK domain-containing protein n=1 Tax=Frondihabitans sucicola TaxID=1268041 RepID=A0ABM8GVH6_9MICO|nr:FtsK/SpoIIIE domain-containing protein [Frondihabitans sucicola]BDZ52472.1 hypothetical protein GCM10025867_47130 [Frondihabitans sucicola]